MTSMTRPSITKKPKMHAVGVNPKLRQVTRFKQAHPNTILPNQVKVQALDVGICGTDREICTFLYGSPPDASDYLVLGHEALGKVVEVGVRVNAIQVGDLVVPSVRRPCIVPECRPCRADRQDFCATWEFTERGIKQRDGYMTEFFVDDEIYFTVVPNGLRDFAVLAEPLSIAEKGLSQVWNIQARLPWACSKPGEPMGKDLRAVVIGAGPIGILGAMLLVLNGFETFVYSRSPKPNEKATLIESFGATYFSTADTTPAQLAERVGNIDLIYEAVGVSEITFDVMMQLGINGVFVLTGIPQADGYIQLEGNQIMRNLVLKNQVIVGTVNADKAAFQTAIRDLGEFKHRWPSALEKIISRHPIDDFHELLTGKAEGIKNVIVFAK